MARATSCVARKHRPWPRPSKRSRPAACRCHTWIVLCDPHIVVYDEDIADLLVHLCGSSFLSCFTAELATYIHGTKIAGRVIMGRMSMGHGMKDHGKDEHGAWLWENNGA
eukprot:1161667-Pelagomonas_calceolata.AAC.6